MPLSPWMLVLGIGLLVATAWMFHRRRVPDEAAPDTRADALLRIPGTDRPFLTASRYEVDNVFGNVVCLDEYHLGPERFDPEDVIVDVGAHVGSFAFLCYEKGSRSIHCFEPDPSNFEILDRNFGAIEGVTLHRTAVWRSDGVDEPGLTISGPAGPNTGSPTVMAGGRGIDFPNQQVIESPVRTNTGVSATPLDDILRRFPGVRLLKLDCEGSEFPILLTSRELDRVARLTAEVHEIDAAHMRLLASGGRVGGHASYTLDLLVEHLRDAGFTVTTRPGVAAHMYWLEARRRPSTPEGGSAGTEGVARVPEHGVG